MDSAVVAERCRQRANKKEQASRVQRSGRREIDSASSVYLQRVPHSRLVLKKVESTSFGESSASAEGFPGIPCPRADQFR